jgi:hypothetical protein
MTRRAPIALLAIAVGMVVVLATITDGCDEQAACRSVLGNGTADWPGGPVAIPVLIGVAALGATWALASLAASVWREARRRLDETGDV